MTFLGENRAPFLAVLLLVASLLLLSAQIRTSGNSRVEAVLLSVVSPLVRLGSGGVDGAGSLWNGYMDLRDLRGENERLVQEIAALRLERQQLEEAGRETRRLHALLELQEALTLPTLAARVMRVELQGPFRLVLLDRGSAHGVRRSDGVITPDGVVGRVTEVAGHISRVQLLIDTSSGAAAMISRTREQGMVVGRRVNELEMRYLSALAEVRPGDSVDTSGLDAIYPKGFRIGRVKSLAGGDRLQQRVLVETAVDFRKLEEVLILVHGPGGAVTPGALDAGREDRD